VHCSCFTAHAPVLAILLFSHVLLSSILYIGFCLTRSVLASELYSIAHGFNVGKLAKSIINKVLEIEVLLIVYIDSKSLYKY
jgi:hypothetical protein